MKRRHYLIYITILIIVIYIFWKSKSNIMVVATSYSDNLTSVNYYKNNRLVKKEKYNIGGVEEVLETNDFIMFDKYGNELLLVKDKSVSYEIGYNPLDINNYNNINYILHNDGINSFNIKLYNEKYEIMQESNKFKGCARNFIFKDNIIYILSNVYDEKADRKVVLYLIDPDSLGIVDTIVINNMTFAFYMSILNEDIYICGNELEETNNLSVCIYNTSDKSKLTRNYQEKAMWVKKILNIGDKVYIINDFSIIILNKHNEIDNIMDIKDKIIIDVEYSTSNEEFFVLIGNYEENEYDIITTNINFVSKSIKKVETYPLIPTCIRYIGKGGILDGKE